MVQVHLRKVDKEILREALKEVLKQALEDQTESINNETFLCELCEAREQEQNRTRTRRHEKNLLLVVVAFMIKRILWKKGNGIENFIANDNLDYIYLFEKNEFISLSASVDFVIDLETIFI